MKTTQTAAPPRSCLRYLAISQKVTRKFGDIAKRLYLCGDENIINHRVDMEIKDKIKRYSTPQECAEVLQGMINLKQQWLDYAKKRETELAIS